MTDDTENHPPIPVEAQEAADGGSDHRLARLRGQVEILRTDQNQIPAFATMGWDEACRRVLALIDEANAKVTTENNGGNSSAEATDLLDDWHVGADGMPVKKGDIIVEEDGELKTIHADETETRFV